MLHHAAADLRFGALLANIDLSNVLQISVLRNLIQDQRKGKLTQEMENELRIVTLVKRYRSWNATKPEDKIYALLGLSPTKEIDFDIDYRRTPDKTYIAFAKAVIEQSNALELFTGVKGHTKQMQSKIPYWVPDWSDTTPQLDLLFSPGIMGFLGKSSIEKKTFAASGHVRRARPGVTSNARFSAHGMRIGEIKELGGAISSSKQNLECKWMEHDEPDPEEIKSSTDSVFALIKTLREWERIAGVRPQKTAGLRLGRDKYCTGEHIEQAYRRLLNVDLAPTRFREEPTSADVHFREWRDWLHVVYKTFKSIRTLQVDMAEFIKRKDTRYKLWDNMKEEIDQRLYGEGGGYTSAFNLTQRDDYLNKIRSSAGAWVSMKRGLYHGRQRSDFNLALVINNPHACSLEHINQRRLAWIDDKFLALVPAEAAEGDHIALLDGGAVPFVVRTKPDRWEMIGSKFTLTLP